MAGSDPEFEDWIQRARDYPILDVASKLGANLRKAGSGEHVGPCPNCGGDDRFQVKPKDGVFLCRGSDGKGDGIAMARHVLGLEFVEACEFILNEPPPRPDKRADPKPIDHDADRAAADMRRDREILDEARDQETRQKKANRSQEVFDGGKAFRGSWAERAFKLRGITLTAEQMEFIRFIPRHPYYHGTDEEGRPKAIGYYPAFVALMRDVHGIATGMHCTYLDADEPIKAVIEVYDEGKDRNIRLNPRKMYGTAGLIWLSHPKPIMAIGEGIETTTSWFALGLGPDDIGIAAAGSLGTMAGNSTGTIQHPQLRNRTIPNGIPDMEDPGPAMPIPDIVREIIFLGDADKNPENTKLHLLTGMARQRALGRSVCLHMSPLPAGKAKWDWNDVLLEQARLENTGAA